MYAYDRRAAEEKDNSFGLGYYPLPPHLARLGRFMDNLKPQKLVSHKVYPREGVHMLTVKVDHQFSIMLADMKNLIKNGFIRMQCNEPGTMGLYFQDVPIPVAADTAPSGSSLTIEQKVERAKQLGKQAFEKGMMRVPAQDPDLRELLKGGKSGDAVAILTAWTRAWDAANLKVKLDDPDEIDKGLRNQGPRPRSPWE